jgi:inosine/xanthosine triphosphatase
MSDRLRVWVGSENPAKLEAVRLGLAPFFPALELAAAAVPSGVPEQPLGLDEIIAGARSRARGAYARAAGRADLAAGLEDGLVPLPQAGTRYLNVGCCVLYDGTEESLGLSAGFEYPPQCVALSTGPGRQPIGAAFDALFRDAEPLLVPAPGRGGLGNIGRLTRGVLTRAEYGAQAVTCAVVRRLHPALYAAAGGGETP